jgi:hypothetical protein
VPVSRIAGQDRVQLRIDEFGVVQERRERARPNPGPRVATCVKDPAYQLGIRWCPAPVNPQLRHHATRPCATDSGLAPRAWSQAFVASSLTAIAASWISSPGRCRPVSARRTRFRAMLAQLASSGSAQDRPPVRRPSPQPACWPGSRKVGAAGPLAVVTVARRAPAGSAWFPAGTIGLLPWPG